MYARVIQVPVHADKREEAIRFFHDTVGPALKTLQGFKNSRFLTNAATNQCLMVTLWETEADRTGAETNGFLQDVLSRMQPYFAGKPTVDYYQVDVQVV